MSIKSLQRVGFLLIVALLTIGCSGEPKGQAGGKPAGGAPSAMGGGQMPPMPVGAMIAKSADLPVVLEFPARLVSSEKVEVRAKVAGTLMAREYNEGSFVPKDTLLFVIDPAKYEAAKDMAEAQFKQADREYKRAKALFAERAISEKEHDAALSAYESTKAALKNAMLDLDYTRVKAPIEGFAGIKAQNNGSLISVGALLTTVTKTSPIHAEFSFSDIEGLKDSLVLASGTWANPTGIKVNIKSENGKPYPNEGRIDFIDSVVDSESGSVKARALVANTQGLLMPGQFARVVLSGFTKQDSFKVPQSAVMQGAQGSFVFVAKDGKAMPQPIKIASTDGQFFVLESGLKEGDVVILNNLPKLRPGAPVAPQLGN